MRNGRNGVWDLDYLNSKRTENFDATEYWPDLGIWRLPIKLCHPYGVESYGCFYDPN